MSLFTLVIPMSKQGCPPFSVMEVGPGVSGYRLEPLFGTHLLGLSGYTGPHLEAPVGPLEQHAEGLYG